MGKKTQSLLPVLATEYWIWLHYVSKHLTQYTAVYQRSIRKKHRCTIDIYSGLMLRMFVVPGTAHHGKRRSGIQ